MCRDSDCIGITAGVAVIAPDNNLTETGRYNLHGQPVSDDYKGIVIVRLSNGSTQKILNR